MSASFHSRSPDACPSQIHLYDNATDKSDQTPTPTTTTSSRRSRPHHSLLRAIWTTDRFNPNTAEKLRGLHAALARFDPNVQCELYHEATGEVIATATPLVVACFEGDPDVIQLLIESGADANQTESEHHLTAIHIICDAEFKGQSMSVSLISLVPRSAISESSFRSPAVGSKGTGRACCACLSSTTRT